MKKVCTFFLILVLLFSFAKAESIDSPNSTLGGLLESLFGVQSELEKDEQSLVEKARNTLRSTWKNKIYGDYERSEHGYLEIVHSQVTYINESYATRNLTGKAGDDLFHNTFCVIDFMLLSDYYGTAPYYFDAGIYSCVIVYRNGKVETVSQSPFRKYYSLTYSSNFSEIIESVHDCGNEYNAAYNLLDE